MVAANSINESTTGVVGFTGTAFTATPVTQYQVLVGGSTSSTLTGVTNGTTGQVLTANSGTNPTWSTPSSFAPNSIIQISDDFIAAGTSNISSHIVSQLFWVMSNNPSFSPLAGLSTAANPGVLQSASVTTGNKGISLGATATLDNAQIILGGGIIVMNFVINIVNLSDVTNRYILRCGMSDTNNTANMTNGVWFEYSDNINSGQWNYKSNLATSVTTATSSTAVTTGWHNLQMTINAVASSVSFAVDGVSLGTAITTNIPTAQIQPNLDIQWGAGTIAVGTILLDLFYFTKNLTTAR